jgi:hypothetical protein
MPYRYTRIKKIFYAFFPLFFLTVFLTADISNSYDDGFGPAQKIESEHFTIYYAPGLDTANLARMLNISPSEDILAGKAGKQAGTLAPAGTGLTDMIDTLFTRVCDILDMQLYSYKGEIKICKDASQLKAVYRSLFDKELTGESFYVNDLNTVYITGENFRQEILGHEIGHAVISHYFVVSPSVKVQEILATYVEYQLRKTPR